MCVCVSVSSCIYYVLRQYITLLNNKRGPPLRARAAATGRKSDGAGNKLVIYALAYTRPGKWPPILISRFMTPPFFLGRKLLRGTENTPRANAPACIIYGFYDGGHTHTQTARVQYTLARG